MLHSQVPQFVDSLHFPVSPNACPGRFSPFYRYALFLLLAISLFFRSPAQGQSWNGNKRLGLHYTQQELAIWKKRAAQGPYVAKGDFSRNSPADWERIKENAKKFMSAPDADRYVGGYTGSGCVPKKHEYNPSQQGVNLRDAAFVYLITEEKRYSDAVRKELLAQAAEPLVDFSNAARWCYLGDSDPGFVISEWLMRLLIAYDYTKTTFSVSEKALMDRWLLNAGLYFQSNLDTFYAKRFMNRKGDNYVLQAYSQGAENRDPKDFMYYGSPQVGFFAKGYSNRNGTIARFVGTVGIFLKNEELIKSGKRWFMEWMRYGVFPTGDVVDLYRGLEDAKEPEKGLNYLFSVVGAMVDLADVLARNGDNSLYEYQTSEGYFGTETDGKSKKSLLLVIQNAQNYLNGKNQHFATTNVRQATDTLFLINGFDPNLPDSNIIVYDTWFSVANHYYRNADIQANYMRKAPGTRPYPAWPRSIGPNKSWGGQAHIYPGVLFMFGQLEDVVYPYPGSAKATAVSKGK